jgi:copper resistance protein C
MMDKFKVALALFLLLETAFAAWPHAFIDHAEPAVGSQIHGAPTQVKIWFTEKLEPALSKIQVFDASGREVDKRDVKIDQSNAALLTVSLPELRPAKYKVVWRAVSIDTHATTGNFTFELAVPSAARTPTYSHAVWADTGALVAPVGFAFAGRHVSV